MSKPRFIQSVIARLCPERDKVDRAIDHAESLWDALTRRGYGAPVAEVKPRERTDWYARLPSDQQQAFDRFWNAYAYKKGRSDAAMVWGQIQPKADEIAHIIHAAKIEARIWTESPPQGQARIYPQGWLSGYRWRDHPQPVPGDASGKTATGGERGAEWRTLMSELNGVQALAKAQPDDARLAAKVDELKTRLHAMEGRA